MKLTTNGTELGDALNGVAGGGADLGGIEDAYRLPLAQAFSSLTRCVDTQSGHDITLLADVQADAVTVSVVLGKASSALAPDVPWQSPHLAEIDRERQARQAEADDVEAERIRELLKR
jgi:hypothetical protein